MRVTKLECSGLFSFGTGDDKLSLNLPDTGVTVVVGPNGSGKSNLLRVLDVIVSAVGACSQSVTVNPTPSTLEAVV